METVLIESKFNSNTFVNEVNSLLEYVTVNDKYLVYGYMRDFKLNIPTSIIFISKFRTLRKIRSIECEIVS